MREQWHSMEVKTFKETKVIIKIFILKRLTAWEPAEKQKHYCSQNLYLRLEIILYLKYAKIFKSAQICKK